MRLLLILLLSSEIYCQPCEAAPPSFNYLASYSEKTKDGLEFELKTYRADPTAVFPHSSIWFDFWIPARFHIFFPELVHSVGGREYSQPCGVLNTTPVKTHLLEFSIREDIAPEYKLRFPTVEGQSYIILLKDYVPKS